MGVTITAPMIVRLLPNISTPPSRQPAWRDGVAAGETEFDWFMASLF